MLTFRTAGESHGKGLLGMVEGMPAGVPMMEEAINFELQRRQKGYGRGGRMQIEADAIEIITGVRHGVSLGSPIGFLIRNQDHENWKEIMNPAPGEYGGDRRVTRPRPGHADLAGAIKYHHADMRNILERASARETAVRVAAGAICRQLLNQVQIGIYSQVIAIGSVVCPILQVEAGSLQAVQSDTEASPVRCVDQEKAAKMMEAIDEARKAGESLGGCFEIGAVGVPPGLGSHVNWDRKLDGILARLLMSIPAIKAVEIGDGIQNASTPGSGVHDEIFYGPEGLYRKTNRAGGIEGGISNGETIRVRAYMKPIPTLYKPLTSVNTESWQEEKADIERSDICAVPAAAVVGEAMLAFGLAQAMLEKFGGDHLEDIQTACESYKRYMKKVWKWEKI